VKEAQLAEINQWNDWIKLNTPYKYWFFGLTESQLAATLIVLKAWFDPSNP
jgi:hypothetical protein